MTLQNFLERLNWRQILLHFIGTAFFIFAFEQFAFLFQIELFDVFKKSENFDEKTLIEIAQKKNYSIGQFMAFNYYINFFWLIGLVIGFITSLVIDKIKKWYWVNSLLVLVISFILGRQDLLGWNYLKVVFLKPGLIFSNSSLYLLTNGVILFAFGIFFFTYRKFNSFINSKKK